MHVLITKLLKKMNLLQFIITNAKINVNNSKIKIPLIGNLGYIHLSDHEDWMIKILERILNKSTNGYFVDVGANLGQTLVKVKSIRHNINYLGFEPSPDCLGYLRRLIKVNKFDKCKIIPSGIFSIHDIVILSSFNDQQADPSATLIENFRTGNKIIDQQYVSVVDFEKVKYTICKDKPVDIIKIDVEGAELEVLQSMKETIISDTPYIICEILPAYSIDNKFRVNRQKQIQILLQKIGYNIGEIDLKGDINWTDSIEVHGDMNRTNYLFKPKHAKFS